jgi:hypothetical protein
VGWQFLRDIGMLSIAVVRFHDRRWYPARWRWSSNLSFNSGEQFARFMIIGPEPEHPSQATSLLF